MRANGIQYLFESLWISFAYLQTLLFSLFLFLGSAFWTLNALSSHFVFACIYWGQFRHVLEQSKLRAEWAIHLLQRLCWLISILKIWLHSIYYVMRAPLLTHCLQLHRTILRSFFLLRLGLQRGRPKHWVVSMLSKYQVLTNYLVVLVRRHQILF